MRDFTLVIFGVAVVGALFVFCYGVSHGGLNQVCNRNGSCDHSLKCDGYSCRLP